VTTSHVLLPHPARTIGALLPFSQPNPSSSGGKCTEGEGGRGSARHICPKGQINFAVKKNVPRNRSVFQTTTFGAESSPSPSFMSIKVSSEIWQGSKHKSGNLLVLLALADHADDRGTAWPGVALLARKARLSQRHTRRCLSQLVASGELEILPNQAPSGRTLYRIRLGKLGADNLSGGASASGQVTPTSIITDADDRPAGPPYIEEPSIKSSEEPSSFSKTNNPKRESSIKKKHPPTADSVGLVSSPKSGF
jgi:hypothetical protein